MGWQPAGWRRRIARGVHRSGLEVGLALRRQHFLRSCNGIERTAGWLGFHAALVIAAAWFWIRRKTLAWRFAAWAIVSFGAVTLGWRFFPGIFSALAGAHAGRRAGMVLLGAKRVIALAALLVPLIRFGPRYVTLARGDRNGPTSPWIRTAAPPPF
jgi:hypothetical protein